MKKRSPDYFDDFFDDVDEINYQPILSEEEASNPLDVRDKSYTDLVDSYTQYYKSKSEVNISLRKSFLYFSFILLTVLILACIGLSVLVCFLVENVVASMVTIISGLASIATSILILPRIIGKYLFPEDEDSAIKDLILHFKDTDDLRRKDDKKGE